MKTQLVKIGNSQGVRIPKPLIEQVGLRGLVEMKAEGNQLVIRPVLSPRAGWAEQFKAMAAGEDKLLDEETQSLTEWEEGEWEW